MFEFKNFFNFVLSASCTTSYMSVTSFLWLKLPLDITFPKYVLFLDWYFDCPLRVQVKMYYPGFKWPGVPTAISGFNAVFEFAIHTMMRLVLIEWKIYFRIEEPFTFQLGKNFERSFVQKILRLSVSEFSRVGWGTCTWSEQPVSDLLLRHHILFVVFCRH